MTRCFQQTLLYEFLFFLIPPIDIIFQLEINEWQGYNPIINKTFIVDHGMVHLRSITAEDIARIKNWPAYVDGFAQIDYALRDNGWLDEYRDRPQTSIFIAEVNRQAAGFCLLSSTATGDAEFRIAIHPRKTGMGLGRKVAVATLKKGFRGLNLDKIHLIVRKNNLPAIRLYQSIGFKKFGESTHMIQGKQIECDDMALTKEEFMHLSIEEAK